MAVKASAVITLSTIRDIQSVTWFYLLQPSTAAAPAKPTTLTPPTITTTGYSGWSETEPSYTAGDTRSLYVTERTVYTDGTFEYTVPSLSSSYEAAKQAYNEAQNAKKTATNFVYQQTGGAAYFHAENSNFNIANADAVKITDKVEIIRSGASVAEFGVSARLGNASNAHSIIDSNGQRFYARDGNTELANLGYGEGAAEESGTSLAPYYTLGQRGSGINDDAGYDYSGIGNYSVAEGYLTVASGFGSHAEGNCSIAKGLGSHAEGTHGSVTFIGQVPTIAVGIAAHAEGCNTTAVGNYSHTQNLGSIANGASQTVIGKYNSNNSDNALEIGNGTAHLTRSNALTVDWNGNVMAQGMAGMIQMFAGSTAPKGWLLCDGSAVSRTTYSRLFAVIGTTYGAGNGSTTFNLPDFRNNFPVGAGSTYALNSKGGAASVTLALTQIPSHTHTQNAHSHVPAAPSYSDAGFAAIRTISGRSGTYGLQSGSNRYGFASNNGYADIAVSRSTGSTTATNQNSGGGQSHENRPPYIGINFIICTGKTS